MNKFSPSIIIAIGANLPGPGGRSPLASCRAAADRIAALPGLHLRALSRWYLTAPMPPSEQPDYINGAALLSGETTPEFLLRDLQAIEDEFGRVRSMPNAARTLDLDIIDFAGLLRTSPDPVLPHPRAQEREFVLRPLADIDPGWVHPVLGRTVADLLAALGPPLARVLPARVSPARILPD